MPSRIHSTRYSLPRTPFTNDIFAEFNWKVAALKKQVWKRFIAQKDEISSDLALGASTYEEKLIVLQSIFWFTTLLISTITLYVSVMANSTRSSEQWILWMPGISGIIETMGKKCWFWIINSTRFIHSGDKANRLFGDGAAATWLHGRDSYLGHLSMELMGKITKNYHQRWIRAVSNFEQSSNRTDPYGNFTNDASWYDGTAIFCSQSDCPRSDWTSYPGQTFAEWNWSFIFISQCFLNEHWQERISEERFIAWRTLCTVQSSHCHSWGAELRKLKPNESILQSWNRIVLVIYDRQFWTNYYIWFAIMDTIEVFGSKLEKSWTEYARNNSC